MLKALSPFVWRKYMDFAALADIHAMKRQIHAYRGHGEIAVAGHNIKLGRGGIREIEFFVQTQQLIAGGRHPELRDRRTLATLESARGGRMGRRQGAGRAGSGLSVSAHGSTPSADGRGRADPHIAVRPAAIERFARFLGFADRGFRRGAARASAQRAAALFALFEPWAGAEGALQFPDEDHRDTLDRLAAMGFRNPLEISAIVRGWLSREISRAAQRIRALAAAGFVPHLIEQLARNENREQALLAFDRFLSPACMPRAARG